MNAVTKWFFAPVPLGRVAVLRVIAYLFIPLDLLVTTRWALEHKDLSADLYQPLWLAREFPIVPTPSHGLIVGLCVALIAVSVLAALGRAPRLLGAVVFVLYFEWMMIAMAYGKVDHDRFAYLVLLAVLPTIGRARLGDKKTLSASAGWAMRCVQVAVICTYFLAAWAKLRFGGLEWLNSATLVRAVLRRGTFFSNWTVDFPFVLIGMQWFIVAFELLSPVVLFVTNDRVRNWIIAGFYGFHVMTFSAITIIFLPHLVAMLAFLPLERVQPLRWAGERFRRRPPDSSAEESAPPKLNPVNPSPEPVANSV